jgi:2,3,4,5-tetrahydropyridine-2-carboxylate N-succinyltransferase
MSELQRLEQIVHAAYVARSSGTGPGTNPVDDAEVRQAVERAIELLDRGEVRTASPARGDGDADGWVIHAWVAEAINLYFALRQMTVMELPPFTFRDKIPIKSDHEAAGVRVVPPGTARYGSHLARGVVLMPAYVNIGAHVGARTMVDTWATVGTGAPIGADVHLAGGVGVGGILEPPGSRPVIVEDGAFIGSRCILVEGVLVEREAVLGANVALTASTPIIDVTGPTEVVYKGRVPARSVVVAGTRPRQFAAGTYELTCALIIGQRTESTDRKTSLNEVLRQHELSV